MVLLCLAFAVFHAPVRLDRGALGARLRRRRRCCCAPFAWVATEILRAPHLLRVPLVPARLQPARQPADRSRSPASRAVYGGLVPRGPGLVRAGLRRRGAAPRAAAGRALAVVVLVAGGGLGQTARGACAQPIAETGPHPRRPRAGGIPQDEKWEPRAPGTNVGRHLRPHGAGRSRGRAPRGLARVRGAVPLRRPTRARRRAAGPRARGSASTCSSATTTASARRGAAASTSAPSCSAPDGACSLRYHKMQLVPFGEYVPLQPLLTLGGRVAAKLVQQVADFTPGDGAAVGERRRPPRSAARSATRRSSPDLVRARSPRAGAELLVNITNDAWYGRTSAPYQHFAMAAFAPSRTGVTWCARRTPASPPSWTRAAASSAHPRSSSGACSCTTCPSSPGLTFYTRHGDVFALGLRCGGSRASACDGRRRRCVARRGR